MHACELAEGCARIRQPTGEPQRGRLGAVHAHVKAQQLALAQQAGRGAAQRAVTQLAVHADVRAQLAPHPVDNLVLLDSVHSCLPDPDTEEPAEVANADIMPQV